MIVCQCVTINGRVYHTVSHWRQLEVYSPRVLRLVVSQWCLREEDYAPEYLLLEALRTLEFLHWV